MLPNFIIVGTPKAGTTSLYHYLSEHPQVFMSEPKEVNYFSKDEIEEQGLYYQDFKAKDLKSYEALFNQVRNEVAIGEGSVSYLYYPKTPQKIKNILPDIKIIILLRDPIERAYSHYLMDFRMGLINLSFEEVVYKTSNHKKIDLFYQQYIELGLYYKQVKRYVDTFGNTQIKIFLQEDLKNNTEKVIFDLYSFLDIDNSIIIDTNQQHNAFSMPKNKVIHQLYSSYIIRSLIKTVFTKKIKEQIKNIFFERKKKPKLNYKTKEYLQKIYFEDIKKLESLINQDLSQWYKES